MAETGSQPDRRNSFGAGKFLYAPNVGSLEARQRWACSRILFEEELRLGSVLLMTLWIDLIPELRSSVLSLEVLCLPAKT